MFFLSAIAFILLLSVLIIIHECGHFAAARKAGVTVEEFGFGLPPKAKTIFKQGGTEFTLNMIPFGGFVRLKGENAMDPKERAAPGSFAAAPIYWRIIILIAGVFMNFALAIALLTIGFTNGHWVPTYLTVEDMREAQAAGIINMELAVVIEDVVSGGAAAKVGVPKGVVLQAVDGQPIEDPEQVAKLQEGKWRVTYTVLNAPEFTESEDYSVILDDGKAGVVIALSPLELSSPRRNVIQGFGLAMRETGVMTHQTVRGLGQLFVSLGTTGRVPEGVTGLVGIAQLTHSSVQAGWMTYLRLVALLSLSLAVLNILPFPALDGGRLVFVLTEVITRRPVNRRFELTVNAVGFFLLLGLIFVITFYDIVRLF